MVVVYGDLVEQRGGSLVDTWGSQPGPVGGDGWTLVTTLPQAALPAGTTRLVVFVNGKVGNIARQGAGTPRAGILQVCLGLASGAKSPLHMQIVPVLEALGPLDGLLFQFCLMQSASPSISDPFFGSTWNNDSGDELAIWARGFWNGDVPTYTAAFEVSDITWLWFDTDTIPGTEQLCEHFFPSPPHALTTTNTPIHLASNTPGASGQKWLHFHCLTYRPLSPTSNAPLFQFGYHDGTSFHEQVGTNGRWGQQRCIEVPTQEGQLSQGCFWYQDHPSGTVHPGVRGQDRNPTTPTQVLRHCYFGLRLDSLSDVLVRTEIDVPNATSSLFQVTPAFPHVYVPLERPATGLVSAPSVFVHGIVQTDGLAQTYDSVLLTNTGRTLDPITMGSLTNGPRGEGVSSMAFSRYGLSASVDDVQYRAMWVGMLNAPPRSLRVRDITIVQTTLVAEADPVPTGPPVPGNPMVLVPGRESADPAGLPAVPFAPDAAMNEEVTATSRGRIAGATGYERTWPLFGRVRRQFGLRWSALTEGDARALFAFLRANPAFRFTPPAELSAIAMLQAARPELIQVSAGIFAVQSPCVELIWTGP